MAAPILSHLISGTVFDIFGAKLAGATVSVKHVSFNQTIPNVTTGSDGKYIANLSKLTTQWIVGDEIQVTANKTAEGTKTVSAIIVVGGSQTVNVTLAETSDFNFVENVFDKHNLYGVIPLHYDKAKVTRTRPLPVVISNIDLVFNPTQTNTYDSKNRLSTETITLANGDTYKRTFTYIGNAFQFTTRGKWIRQ